jgi:hypothetical protein
MKLADAWRLKNRRSTLNKTEQKMDIEAIDYAPGLEIDSAESQVMDPLTTAVPDPIEPSKGDALSRVMERVRKKNYGV